MKYRINYSKVISQADSIAGNAADLSTQIRALEQVEQECRSVWKGQAADVPAGIDDKVLCGQNSA